MSWLFAIGLLSAALTEGDGVRRVHAHLLLEDTSSALVEAEELRSNYPDSGLSGKTLVEAYAACGMEEKALDLWNQLTFKDPGLLYDRNLLEELAWGVLKKGTLSNQYGVRLAAIIGSYLTRDVRAIPVLIKMMRDSNAVIRSVAIQMSADFRDAPLKDEVIRLFSEEKIWSVRLEVIKAVGALKIKSLRIPLQTLVQSEKTPLEERHVAITSLLSMYDAISLPELQVLAKSSRAGLRHLACCIIAHFQMDNAKEEILSLIQDTNAAVRIAAINALGMLYRNTDISALSAKLNDPDPAVAITAAWAAYLIDSSVGQEHMKKWLNCLLPENRRMAAAALAAVGARGVPLSIETIKTSTDPYVKVNLAIGLLGQRVEVKMCCDLIYDFLEIEKRMLMVDQRPNPLFGILAPSQVRYNDQIPNYPEAKDLMTRLHLVSFLALVEDPRALTALKTFLQRKTWGISGFAAATLLHEGDDSALELVKELVNDPDPNVSLQACFVLAMFGKDETVLHHLQGAYATADNEKKLHILEAVGQVGNAKSYSFLAGVMREPFPILRVAAAASLIQSVNR